MNAKLSCLIPLVYIGIFDGSQKAYISEIANPSLKATALGTVATLTGLITLPSKLGSRNIVG
jgi:hypothetical protein